MAYYRVRVILWYAPPYYTIYEGSTELYDVGYDSRKTKIKTWFTVRLMAATMSQKRKKLSASCSHIRTLIHHLNVANNKNMDHDINLL